MSNARSITYKLRAEYEGKGDIKQLNADLKALGQVESIKKLGQSFAETNTKMVEAKQRVRSLKQDMKQAGGEAFAEEYAKAKTEVVKLNTSLQKQKANLDKSRKSLQSQGVDVADITAKYGHLTTAVQNQGQAMAARQTLGVRSFKDVKQEIVGLEKAYKDLERSGTASTSELATAKGQLLKKTERLNAEMGKGVKKYSAISKTMGSMRTSALNLVAPVTALLGIAGVMGIGFGIKNLVTDVVRAEKELGYMSRTAGQSVSDFQAYAYGIQSVGMEADKLADISKDVKDKIGDFAETGGGEFKDFFENIGKKAGLAAEDLLKLSGPDALIAVKKAMDDVNISAENQVFYLEAIANDASLLIPLLANNGAEWKKLAGQAQEMGIAISDLDHSKLMELSKTLAELQLSLGVTRREIVLALAPALKDMSEYFSQNREELQAFVIDLAKGAGEMASWVVENRDLVVTLGKLAFGILAVNTVGGTLVKTIGLVSKAMAFLSGAQVIAKMMALRNTVGLLSASFLGTAGMIGAVVVAAGFAIAGIAKFISHYREMKQLNAEIEGQTKSNAEAQKVLAGRFAEISQASGVTVSSMEELDAAVKAGKIHFDEATASWVAGSGVMADATRQTASVQKQVTGAALKKMQQQYEQHVSKIKSLQDSIADNEMRLYQYLRDLSREGMSDGAAYKDLKQEAEEYRQKAEEALAVGDSETALQYFKLMEDAYKSLASQVSEGDKQIVSLEDGIKTKKEGVTTAIEGQITAQKQLQEAERKSMEALTEKSGFQDLGKSMDDTKKKWLDNWQKMRAETVREIDAVEDRIKSIKDGDVTIWINEKVKKATGGLIGSAQAMATGGRVGYRNMLTGGHFPGYGGGDRRHVVAEDGEVMIRKESVRSAGLRAALAFNAGRFDIVMKELSSRFDLGSAIRRNMGGIINSMPRLAPLPVLGPQMMAAGGVVSGGGAASTTTNITLNYSGSGSRQDARQMADMVMNELQRRSRGSSK